MKKYLLLFLLLVLFSAKPAHAGTLSCTVGLASACVSPAVVIYRMSSATDAHAELPSQSTPNYDNNVVCCTGVIGIGNSCSGVFATALNLNKVTNSHSEINTFSDYANSACISVPTGSSISVGYVAGTSTCASAGYDTTLGSIAKDTNSHVGNPAAYTGASNKQICATAADPPATGSLTSSVFDTGISAGSVGYNSIMWKGSLGGSGLNQGKVSFQFSAAPASTGPWNYYGGATCGALDWFDTTGPDQPVELIGTGVSAATCRAAWNNKQYFRYKVKICSSNNCLPPGIYPSPRVDDIIVNWSP